MASLTNSSLLVHYVIAILDLHNVSLNMTYFCWSCFCHSQQLPRPGQTAAAAAAVVAVPQIHLSCSTVPRCTARNDGWSLKTNKQKTVITTQGM